MVEKPSKLQPVLLGGLVLGLGSVIPGLSYGNLCCCGWAVVGGALAARLLIKRSPVLPITSGDGAAAGALVGIVGSFINLIIGVPVTLLQWKTVVAQMQQRADNVSDPASREMVRQMTDAMQSHPALIALGLWLLFAIAGVGMAALGGVLGVAMFEKRKGQPPPQPPYPPAGFPHSYAAPDQPPGEPTLPSQPTDGGSEPPSR
ncbi:MAG TPA: hypothetical protein VN937_29990 [Blastocatellia bacterium]|nr:hypothetical protein [Blastocatellia bacterium]